MPKELIEYADEDGNPYYYDADSGEYMWDVPEGAVVVKGDGAAKVDIGADVIVDLKGVRWLKKTDDGGQAYYENQETGETSWEIPECDAQKTSGLDAMKKALEGKLKKVDPEIQKKMREARERQQKLEQSRDQDVNAGGEHWIEVFDPASDAFYYYGSYTGQMRWDKPENYVMAADDDLMQAVIKIQCAFRARLARRKMEKQRETKKDEVKEEEPPCKWFKKTVEETTYYYNRFTGACTEEKPNDYDGTDEAPSQSLTKLLNAAIEKKIRRKKAAENEWVQMYDPATKEYYYYCKTTKKTQTEEPTRFVKSSEDPMTCAVIKIQCMYRARVARRRMAKQRLSAAERLQIAEKKAEEDLRREEAEQKKERKEMQLKQESNERRAMLEEERMQCRHGDRFWGVDQAIREILRQRVEEKLMMEAEAFRAQLQDKAKRRREYDQKVHEENERRRRIEDTENEQLERNLMLENEQEQCLSDRFWGIEKDEADRQRHLRYMAFEDALSRKYNKLLKEQAIHRRWAKEAGAQIEKEAKKRLANEKRYQRQYMRLFSNAESSELIINFRWPTKRKVVSKDQAKKKYNKHMFLRSLSSGTCEDSDTFFRDAPSSNGFDMNIVYDPARIVNPKNVFHVADSMHTSGRKGKLDLSARPNAYKLDSSPLLSNMSPKKAFTKRKTKRNTSEYQSIRAIPLEENPIIGLLGGKVVKSNSMPVLGSQKSAFGNNNESEKEDKLTAMLNAQEAERLKFEVEHDVLKKVFSLIDLDGGGTINKDEMTWALTRDRQVKNLASKSLVLRPALKNRTVQTIFDQMDGDGSGNVTWEEFEDFFMKSLRETTEKEKEEERRAALQPKRSNEEEQACIAKEEAMAKRVFALVDSDGSGTIDQNEMMTALAENDEVREFVQNSKALRPLLENSMFQRAFVAMNTDDDDGISLDEFVTFCTELASVAMLNDL